jgi:hypothetical protein
MTLTLIRDIDLDLPAEVTPATAPPQRIADVGEFLPLDVVEEWGRASFPASDPPANW